MPEHTIQVSADIGGVQISFAKVDATLGGEPIVEHINDTLDTWSRAIGRQRAKVTLTEKLVDLLASQKAMASLPEREKAALAERQTEKDRLVAKFMIEHNASGRRGEFKLSPQHRRALDEFDLESQKLRKKFTDEREAHALQQPVIEAQIARLRAVIAGRDPTEALEIEHEALSSAA